MRASRMKKNPPRLARGEEEEKWRRRFTPPENN